MDELYALEAQLRLEVDRLVDDYRDAEWTVESVGDLMRRSTIFKMLCNEERSFQFDWVEPPRFDELWENA